MLLNVNELQIPFIDLLKNLPTSIYLYQNIQNVSRRNQFK